MVALSKEFTLSQDKLTAAVRQRYRVHPQTQINLLPLELTGHQPGPNGAAVKPADQHDPDKLFLPQNDDFDLNLRNDDGLALRDNHPSKEEFDTTKDHDYMKITLGGPKGLNQGTLSLSVQYIEGGGPALATTAFHVWTMDGQTQLESSDMTLDLSNPVGGLAPVASSGKMDLIIESSELGGREDIRLVWKYENGSMTAEQKLHFHVLDVDFMEASPNSGFDDNNDEPEPAIPYPAIMVPLPAGGGNGTNQVKVAVEPASFFERIEIKSENTQIFTVTSTIASASEDITITGLAHESTEVFINFNDEEDNPLFETARMYVDVKQYLPATGIIGYKVFRVKDDLDDSVPTPSLTDIDDFLDDAWKTQANVKLSKLVSGSIPTGTFNYDSNSIEGLEVSLYDEDEESEVKTIIDHPFLADADADINIIYVSKIEGGTTKGFEIPHQGRSYIFIEAGNGLDIAGHEVGHALGINDIDGEGHGLDPNGNDLMWKNVGNSGIQDHVRRYDWNAVNP